MVDDQAKPGEQPEDDEPEFEAPARGSADELLDAGAHAPIDAMRHSTAHVMAEAVLELFPGAKLGIGPAIEDGFYYDFELPRPLTPDDLAAIEARMARRASRPTTRSCARRSRSTRAGRSRKRDGQPFKVEILDDLARKAEGDRRADAAGHRSTSTARSATCARGRTSRRPGTIGPFKLLASPARTGGATRSARCSSGSTARSGETQAELDQYLWRRAEAKKRDHRKLGVAARPVQLPRRLARARPSGTRRASGSGARSRRRCASSRSGAATTRSRTPILVHEKLWHQSGHLPLYADNMFLLEVEGQTFSLKPMNCPESTYIYRSHLRSYRDLPLRYNEYGRLHRNERSGTLSGLTRVRQFIQDDAHIYVRPDQLADEIEALLGEVREAYAWVGLRAPLRVRDQARQGARRPGAVGAGRAADQGGARSIGHARTSSSPRTARSTRPRSTSTSTTRSAASGRWPRSRPT